MTSGNVNFPGIVRVNGCVQPGFRVIAAGDIEVEETVDAALLSSEGSILIGQGIKGEGKAILRAKKDIASPFAEQAILHRRGKRPPEGRVPALPGEVQRQAAPGV